MKTLLLLHGAIGAADQLMPLQQQLEKSFDVHTLNFSGHGGAANGAAFSISTFAQEVLNYVNDKGFTSVSIFGYSMGGYVAMYLAKYSPETIEKVATLATKFEWDDTIAAKESAMLDAEKIAVKVPAFADVLSRRHAPNDWKEVLDKTKTMLLEMGKDNPLKATDYESINIPVLVLIGDRDKMVSLDETLRVYKSLPNAQMGMLPDTQHPIEQADAQMLAAVLDKFMK